MVTFAKIWICVMFSVAIIDLTVMIIAFAATEIDDIKKLMDLLRKKDK